MLLPARTGHSRLVDDSDAPQVIASVADVSARCGTDLHAERIMFDRDELRRGVSASKKWGEAPGQALHLRLGRRREYVHESGHRHCRMPSARGPERPSTHKASVSPCLGGWAVVCNLKY
eukprot:scaffold4243_cov112-Isochrysis_galbana.AAC.3